MKKFLAVAALVAAACFATSAHAAPVLVTKVLQWRHQFGTAPNGAFQDSSYFSFNSSGTGPAATIDTSAAFTLPGRAFPITAIQVGADSALVFQFSFGPTNSQGSTGGCDSATVTLQGSLNGGETWVGAPAIDILQIGSSACFERTWNSTTNASAPATATNVTMGYYPVYRILVKDFTGSTGQFKGQVRYVVDQGASPVPVGP